MQVDERGAYIDADVHALAFFERTRDEMLAATVRDDFPTEVVADILAVEPRERVSEREVACRGRRPHQAHAAQRRAHAHRRAPRQLPARRRHHASRRACRRPSPARSGRSAVRRRFLTSATPPSRSCSSSASRTSSSSKSASSPTSTSSSSPPSSGSSRALRHRPERLEVDAVRANLREIVGPFGQRLARRPPSGEPLTRREKEVAALVRQGTPAPRSRRPCT